MITYYYAIKVETTNDGDGNPRRGWIICVPSAGRVVGFAPERSRGRLGALTETAAILAGRPQDPAARFDIDTGGYRSGNVTVIELDTVQCTPAEYRDRTTRHIQF